MKRINEIFYSLQGEGFWVGRPAVFVRFCGCNLSCPFCDTNHAEGKMMSDEEIIAEVSKYPASFVVLTGGEPALFIDKPFVDALRERHFFVAIETNGTVAMNDALEAVDWITLSPKDQFVHSAVLRLSRCDELKLLYPSDPTRYEAISASAFFLQPCDMGNETENKMALQQTIDYVKSHPQWRLSLQTHKIINIP